MNIPPRHVTAVLYCGHRLTFTNEYGYPRRRDYVFCLRCGDGAHVKELVWERKRIAA